LVYTDNQNQKIKAIFAVTVEVNGECFAAQKLNSTKKNWLGLNIGIFDGI
jgi:hypothetical protein